MLEIRSALLLNYLNNIIPYLGKQHEPVDIFSLLQSYEASSLAGICKCIKTQMGLRTKVRLNYIDNEGMEKDPPCWVDDDLNNAPHFDSPLCPDYIANVYIRRPRFEDMSFCALVFALAHELTHIVLVTKRSPLCFTEEAVDIGAILLGYGSFYVACKHERVNNYFGIGPFQFADNKTCIYGYLSMEEILYIQCILGR